MKSTSLFLFALVSSSLVACASSRAGTTTTHSAVDVAQEPSAGSEADAPVAREATPEATEAKPEAKAEAKNDAGELVCRAKDAFGSTSELFVTWNGKEGTGLLRSVGQSGEVHELRVKTEREGTLMFADDARTDPDLLVHAATVGKRDGKTYMRLGDMKAPWTPCE